jgi:hypothetical protein
MAHLVFKFKFARFLLIIYQSIFNKTKMSSENALIGAGVGFILGCCCLPCCMLCMGLSSRGPVSGGAFASA